MLGNSPRIKNLTAGNARELNSAGVYTTVVPGRPRQGLNLNLNADNLQHKPMTAVKADLGRQVRRRERRRGYRILEAFRLRLVQLQPSTHEGEMTMTSVPGGGGRGTRKERRNLYVTGVLLKPRSIAVIHPRRDRTRAGPMRQPLKSTVWEGGNEEEPYMGTRVVILRDSAAGRRLGQREDRRLRTSAPAARRVTEEERAYVILNMTPAERDYIQDMENLGIFRRDVERWGPTGTHRNSPTRTQARRNKDREGRIARYGDRFGLPQVAGMSGKETLTHLEELILFVGRSKNHLGAEVVKPAKERYL